jgi:hypothetical protein
MPEMSRGAPLPERGRDRTYQLVWPRVGVPLSLTMLSPTWLGLWTHWVRQAGQGAGRSELCLADAGVCPHCGLAPLGWSGYLCCLVEGSSERCILIAHDALARQIQKLASGLTGLRGVRCKILKSRAQANSPCIVEESGLGRRSDLPLEWDIEPTLMALWKLSQRPTQLQTPHVKPVADSSQADGEVIL